MKKCAVRIIATLSAAFMLLPSLASCFGEGVEETAAVSESQGFDAEVRIGDYRVVRSAKAGESAIAATVSLRNSIEAATGVRTKIVDDWTKPGENDDYSDVCEVLIGNTTRPESAEASAKLAAAGAAGYIILVSGKKIVVAASSDALLGQAVRYFADTYLAGVSADGLMKLRAEYIAADFGVYDIMRGGKSEFTIVRPENADGFTIALTTELGKKIRELTGGSIKLGTDWTKTGGGDKNAYEILIGDTSREETREFLGTLGADEYGIAFIGRKIVVAGLTSTTTGEAVGKLTELLGSAVAENADGKKDISLTAAEPLIYRRGGWITDFPKFSGGTLSGAYDAGGGALEYYYTGADAEKFRLYKAELASAGYTLFCENAIGSNLFATYKKGGDLIHIYYVSYLGAVRVITRSAGALPTLSDAGHTKKCAPSLTAAAFTYAADGSNVGQCEIIRLSDGSFFIVDSGCAGLDADLYNTLVSLNGGKDGIVIAAWFFTHGHADHYGGFVSFAQNYAKSVTLEAVYISPVAESSNAGTKYQTNWDFAGTHIGTYTAKFGAGIPIIRPHTGWKFAVRDAEVEMLYTQEDLYPSLAEWYNDYTAVFRVKIAGQTILFLGDVMDSVSSATICKLWDAGVLGSDILQAAHHGTGGSTTLYGLVRPTVVIFPCAKWQYDQRIISSNPTRELVRCASVKKIIVSDNGSTTITLPYIP